MAETILKDKKPQREAKYKKITFDKYKCKYLKFKSELNQQEEGEIFELKKIAGFS